MTSIVVFDGECALCNGFVAWLIRHDKDGRFLIAGSAGPVGRAVIDRAGLAREISASTIIVWHGGTARIMSDAVLTILARLPWPWKVAVVGRLMPRPFRDVIYRFIAARRARVHAEDPSCGVPPAALVARWRSRLATLADLDEATGHARPHPS